MTEESNIMRGIHKIREDFYRETKGKSKEYILRRIKEDSQKVAEELKAVAPDPRLVVKGKHPIPIGNSMKEIYQIRESRGKYRNK
jgi:hypothetical protein